MKIKIFVRTPAETEMIIKQGLNFSERYIQVENYVIGSDMLFTCRHWEIFYDFLASKKSRCCICAKPHPAFEYKLSMRDCQTARAKSCTRHGSSRCANCVGKHMTNSSVYPELRQAVAIARSYHEELK